MLLFWALFQLSGGILSGRKAVLKGKYSVDIVIRNLISTSGSSDQFYLARAVANLHRWQLDSAVSSSQSFREDEHEFLSIGYNDTLKEIPDPDAKKSEDWDDEEDGEWIVPTYLVLFGFYYLYRSGNFYSFT
ncbi:hypothetical protein L1987_42428 [Smallanthus sonchifolius]|uniref:Uncharacterized protein n=1 Tax=Smallanthus sonchifolius TaxID=185202 RepID=A0ACB9GIU1_9ASTR|nr:hypothetical protein L1987_42428 [Smallanthus sonchifolius]